MTWADKFFLSEEKANARHEQCRACSYYTEFTKICSMCRCFMPAKVKLHMAECPIGKWKKEIQ